MLKTACGDHILSLQSCCTSSRVNSKHERRKQFRVLFSVSRGEAPRLRAPHRRLAAAINRATESAEKQKGAHEAPRREATCLRESLLTQCPQAFSAAVLLELAELAKPVEMPCRCCDTSHNEGI